MVDISDKKTEDASISILDEKIDLLKQEVQENKLYLELCFIALLVLVFGYFKSDQGLESIRDGKMMGYAMITIAIGLYLGVVYFFYSIVKFNQRNRKLIKQKIDKIVSK